MIATPTTTIAREILYYKTLLDPRIFAVIDKISDEETYERILYNIPLGLDTQDVLLITSMLNFEYPPTDPLDIAECLGDGRFTVVLNPLTHKLEWESDAIRYDEAWEWIGGDNAFGYTPPERILVKAMTFDGNHIQHIKNPTEKMKIAAVECTSSAIEYIKYPSDVVRQAATRTAYVESVRAKIKLNRCRKGVLSDNFMAQNTAPCPTSHNFSDNEVQDEPMYFVQDIGPLNLFSDLLLCTVMELNSRIGNNKRAADFVHVSKDDVGLILSFATIRQIFSLRDVFRELAAKRSIEGGLELAFDRMDVIAYPGAEGQGLVTWGAAAAVK